MSISPPGRIEARPSCRGDRSVGRQRDRAQRRRRSEEAISAFLAAANDAAPLELVVFNIGANVNFPILDTTERVFARFGKWPAMPGFLTGREAARHLLANEGGSIFFTGATASMRGGAGYAAFASAKFGLRAVAQAMARELGPQNIHVAIWSSIPRSIRPGCASGSREGDAGRRRRPTG